MFQVFDVQHSLLIIGDKDLIRVVIETIDKDSKKKDTIIGMLPEEESKVMKDILKNGWDLFSGTICKIDKQALYDQRISVAVYIKKHDEKQ